MRVQIRRASESDLPALVEAFGHREYFRTHLAKQDEGRGMLLVAFNDRRPVGHVYVWLGPPEEPDLRKGLDDVRLLTRLEVARPYRGRGIGTELVRAAEDVIGRVGSWVALGVSPEEGHLHAFYERLGYRLWREELLATWREVYHRDGRVERIPDLCRVFVKRVRRANGTP
ncbi:GNAT family N-acetyltransferase [Thermoactinospora rubra]|uniref:GNAT family N-acetyltransferase n=1 Tax=Thermoactinospora rubra TaxID=1088767 RepID=UPI000A0F80D5|nr:GNAT family N-acetyltransferase [Thermoactinospora rubra]